MCPLRPQCVAAAPGTGRAVRLHPQEALLQQARALQQSEAFGKYRQRRVVVEHRLARLVQLGIRQSRYFGRIKTRFQLYLAATVANLTLVAAKAGLPTDTEGGSSVGSALRTGTIRSALDFVSLRGSLKSWPWPCLRRPHCRNTSPSTRLSGQIPRPMAQGTNTSAEPDFGGRPILYGQSDLSSSQPGLM